MYKVTVIVPIYNVENYFLECIESLVSQSIDSMEIILINDGSTDKSLAIAQEYAINYPYINLISKENGGQSSARNLGIKHAEGEFIIFIDSDDFIDIYSLEKLYETAKKYNLDIVRGKCQYCNEKGEKISDSGKVFNPNYIYSGREYFIESLKQNAYDIVPVVNLIRRDYIVNNELTFQEGVYYEDQEFTLKLLTSGAKRIMQLDYKFYFYRQRNGSTTSKNDIKKTRDFLVIIRKMFEYAKKFSTDIEYQKYAYTTVSLAMYHMTQVYIRMSKKDKEIFLQEIDKGFLMEVSKLGANRFRIKIQNYLFIISPRLLELVYKVKGLFR